jgi:hypothetical protein
MEINYKIHLVSNRWLLAKVLTLLARKTVEVSAARELLATAARAYNHLVTKGNTWCKTTPNPKLQDVQIAGNPLEPSSTGGLSKDSRSHRA